MASEKQDNEKTAPVLSEAEKEARQFAALCYVPVMLINFAAMFFVFFEKKGGKYARFHALQSLALTLIIVISVVVLNVVVIAGVMAGFMSGNLLALVGVWALTMVAAFALVFIPLVALVVIAIRVWGGHDVRLPLIAKYVDGFM
ncbi:Uncharacterised protein [uncultured archaeon]|nr:Uncharacterised protein [uncultured archaeon]